jgi:hypothetical protein
MEITPELISHNDFHKGLWLLSQQHAGWYYFMKKNNPCKVTARTFLKSVDGPLRKLVKFLHKYHITTTPSCAGHHIGERNLEKIYDTLEKDCKDIQNGGLQLKDVQTGNTFLYSDKDYKLPWGRKTFIKKLSSYQHHGIIGLKLGRLKKFKEKILQLKVKGANIYEKDGIVFIFVKGYKDIGNERIWGEVTRKIKTLFAVNR